MEGVKQYKFGLATVRVHGFIERERLERPTFIFLKKVETKRKGAKSGNKHTSGSIKKQ